MVLILNDQEQSVWFSYPASVYPSVLRDSSKMDYPFPMACVEPPPPPPTPHSEKIGELVAVAERVIVHRLVSRA